MFSGHAKKGTTKSIWGRERCSVQQKGPDAGFTELQSQVGWIVRPFFRVVLQSVFDCMRDTPDYNKDEPSKFAGFSRLNSLVFSKLSRVRCACPYAPIRSVTESKTPPGTAPGKPDNQKDRRFQIVKLEERIAPTGTGNGKTGDRDQCNGHTGACK